MYSLLAVHDSCDLSLLQLSAYINCYRLLFRLLLLLLLLFRLLVTVRLVVTAKEGACVSQPVSVDMAAIFGGEAPHLDITTAHCLMNCSLCFRRAKHDKSKLHMVWQEHLDLEQLQAILESFDSHACALPINALLLH